MPSVEIVKSYKRERCQDYITEAKEEWLDQTEVQGLPLSLAK